MTTSNLSIVDSLIRSHFGSNLWTKSSDVNFFNDDRIKQINQCFKDLPVKSKLYILMALGNLDSERFHDWRKEVDSIFLRAMVEGNLLVRAIATILQQKFSLNYLTFDISLSLENFAEILNKLSSNLHDWDVSGEIRTSEYISENVVIEMARNINGKVKVRKRRLGIDEEVLESKEDSHKNLGCRLEKLPRSHKIKEDYLKKIEAECNKKRVSVPIPGRNKLASKMKEEKTVPNVREMIMKSTRDSEQQRKDLELEAKLEETKKKLQQKNLSIRKESKIICLSVEETPIMGPKAKMMMKEREKEAKRIDREEKTRKMKEERELERLQKQQEKEKKKVLQQMLLEQNRKEKEEMMVIEEENPDEQPEEPAEEEMAPPNQYMPMEAPYQPQMVMPQQIRLIPTQQGPYQMQNIRIISSQSLSSAQRLPEQQQQQQQTPLLVLRSPSQFENLGSAFSSVPAGSQQQQQPQFIEYSQQNNVKLVRIVNNDDLIQQQQQQQQQQPRIFRIIGPGGQINTASTGGNANTITISPNILQQHQIHQQQQMPPLCLSGPSAPLPQQQQQQHQPQPQPVHLETMKMLVRYANRLSRPQKAMIVSLMAGSADGADYRGQTSVHLSSHRSVDQPLIVDAFFLVDGHSGRWSVVRQYREPRSEEELLGLEVQPAGYPPEMSGQAG